MTSDRTKFYVPFASETDLGQAQTYQSERKQGSHSRRGMSAARLDQQHNASQKLEKTQPDV